MVCYKENWTQSDNKNKINGWSPMGVLTELTLEVSSINNLF